MAGKPKEKDYRPSETEKIQAAVAAADAAYFQQTYDPLLVEMRDRSKEDLSPLFAGRAQADTMQALSPEGGAAGYSVASDIDMAANLARGATEQLLSANVAAKREQIKRQTEVLGVASGQSADATQALSQVSRLERSKGLAEARAKQDLRLAKRDTAFKAGMSLASQGLKNYRDTGNVFTAQSASLSIDPATGDVGYKRWGPFGSSRPFNPLYSTIAKPKNTTDSTG